MPAMAAEFAVASSDAKNGSLSTPEFQTLRPIYTNAVDDRNPPSRNIAFQNKTVGPSRQKTCSGYLAIEFGALGHLTTAQFNTVIGANFEEAVAGATVRTLYRSAE